MKLLLVFVALLGATLAAPPAPRSLNDDLNELMGILDLPALDAILLEEAQTNGDLIEVIQYLRGPAWASIVEAIAAHPNWQEFRAWLESTGIPVQEIVDGVHQLIADIPLGEASGDGTLSSFLDKIVANIDIEGILAWAIEKELTSEDFRELIERVKSDSFHKLVDDILKLAETTRILIRLIEMGVDVDGIMDVIWAALGWGTPPYPDGKKKQPRDLMGDFGDLIAVLPIPEISGLVEGALANDGAFAAVVLYLQSDEWHALVDEVLADPTAEEFVQYLTDAGVPVDAIIEGIHLYIESLHPTVDPDDAGSLRPLLDSIEAILPLEELLAILNDKLANSPDFQDFYATISSQDAHDLVERVRALPEVQRLAQRLRDFGVKVDEVLAAIYAFLGWGAP